jgi:hypothetical protein
MASKSLQQLEVGKCYSDLSGAFLGLVLAPSAIWSTFNMQNGVSVYQEYNVAPMFTMDDQGQQKYNNIRVEKGDEAVPQFLEVPAPENTIVAQRQAGMNGQ